MRRTSISPRRLDNYSAFEIKDGRCAAQRWWSYGALWETKFCSRRVQRNLWHFVRRAQRLARDCSWSTWWQFCSFGCSWWLLLPVASNHGLESVGASSTGNPMNVLTEGVSPTLSQKVSQSMILSSWQIQKLLTWCCKPPREKNALHLPICLALRF